MGFKEWWFGEQGAQALESSDSSHLNKKQAVIIHPDTVTRQQFTDGSINKAIFHLRDAVVRLPVGPTIKNRYARSSQYSSFISHRAPFPNRAKVADRFELLATQLNKVSFDRASILVLTRIKEALNTRIPNLIREAEVEFQLEGWDDEEYRLETIQDVLEALIVEVGKLPSIISTLHTDWPETQVEMDEDKALFPDIITYNEDSELYEALAALQKDWELANSVPLGVEDRFTVDQVASSYLPDALQFHNTFSLRTGSLAKERARTLLLEQVELIHKQIHFVLEQHTDESFSDMEAHTNFLRAKNQQLGL
jgi:hypothetical protein